MNEVLPKIFKLETQPERETFFYSLWKTELFKHASHDENSLVGSLIKEYRKYPRYYYQMQDQVVERAAFTSWYNVLSLKNYNNSYIHDLYLLHELTHICSMPYNFELSFEEWQSKMRENEVWASLVSEVFIYFELPSLRENSFNHPIWVDMFLNKEEFKGLPMKDLYYSFLPIRLKAYVEPKNDLEKELGKYKQFSFLYYNTWKDFYLEVEKAVVNLKNNNQEKEFESFLHRHQSERGILFEDRVRTHHDNYERLKALREQY